MSTQYLTIILRLRLEDQNRSDPSEDRLCGSLQLVGLQKIHYFDTTEKFQETLQQLVKDSSSDQLAITR
jgi:hypothetical protein